MNQSPEHESHANSLENNRMSFTDKLHELLPGIEFKETVELLEARRAVLQALERYGQDTDSLRPIWVEYTKLCEQIVDKATPSDAPPQIRIKLQIAALVHKALIYREFGNMQRYKQDLAEVEEYAYDKYIDEVAEAIGAELDTESITS